MDILGIIIAWIIVGGIMDKSKKSFESQERMLAGFYKIVIYGIVIIIGIAIVIQFFPIFLIGGILYFFWKNRTDKKI